MELTIPNVGIPGGLAKMLVFKTVEEDEENERFFALDPREIRKETDERLRSPFTGQLLEIEW